MPDEFLEDPYLSVVRIGADAEVFLGSSLGRYLQDRSNKEIREATVELIDADPEDVTENRKIRQRIFRAGDALEWLIGAINNAEQAKIEIHQQEALD